MTTALVVVGHGTKSARGAAAFLAFVDRVQELAPGLQVAGGFLELSDPPLREAVATLVSQGHQRLAVVPLVLVGAGHAKGDVPAAMLRETLRHPGLTYTYGRPLGPHPSLLSVLDDRVDAVLARELRPGTAVVLVGRGSTDPDGNADIAKTARLFFEGREFAMVEPAYVSLADPSVPAALERCRLLGAQRIVVLPYLLFDGVLPDRVVAQAAAFAALHPALDVRTAPLLGIDDRIVHLVLERHAEAVAGDVRMSCDTCIYRAPLVGFEHRVGAPQTPHDHPSDPAHSHGDAHGHGLSHVHAP
ncbi:MAG: sirohydrochlorin cobaltochelatase [Frankiaceae bacterium]|nr:sirohydrochlorin cobaltochelatase [Frankiaceae bacterium]